MLLFWGTELPHFLSLYVYLLAMDYLRDGFEEMAKEAETMGGDNASKIKFTERYDHYCDFAQQVGKALSPVFFFQMLLAFMVPGLDDSESLFATVPLATTFCAGMRLYWCVATTVPCFCV